MITFIVGNPGSGKSYLAAFRIYQFFLYVPPKTFLNKFINQKDEPKKTYSYLYTNINQFKFDINEKFIRFEFDKFYDGMSMLYALYLDKVSDDVLNEKAKELKLNFCLIVLDEAHNFLKSKNDPVLVWWLTYHRHLYQDIILITQDLTLINSEYRRACEFFIKAIDSSSRILKNRFKYTKYSTGKMYKKDELERFTIPYLQEVFDLYHSGQVTSQYSFVRKFIFLAVVIFIVLVALFSVFVDSFKPEVDSDSTARPAPSQPPHQPQAAYKPQQPQTKQETQKPTYIYNLSCIDDVCSFAGDNFKFPYAYVAHIIRQTKPFYFYQETKNPHLTEYFLVFQVPALEDLKNTSIKFKNKGVSDENQELSIPNPFSGK